jgi:ATPase subunit of ABC transporter with duplicated ATPase domains
MRAAKAVERRMQRMLDKEKADKPFVEKDRKVSFSAQPLSGKFILRVENLGMRFDSRYVFRNVTFAVRNGVKIGIIGRNGSGKSTLLKIITANLSGHDGSYVWSPQVKIGYYSQEHETLDMTRTILEEVLQGNYQDQTRARTILGRLNIRRDKVQQAVGTLSLGERSKTALAKILFSDANVLVLDEPTNHVELSAREAFEEALEEYVGVVLIASHDRYLLDRIADEIFDVENNRYFSGTYGQYLSGPDDVRLADDIEDMS